MNFLAAASIMQGILSAWGTLQQGAIEIAQLEGAAAADRFNAAISRQRAEATRGIYGEREAQVRREGRMELAKQDAIMAESRLGGNADLERQNAVLAELDALNVRYEGALEAHGYEAEAAMGEFQGELKDRLANRVSFAAQIGAAGNLLGGAGQAYGAWDS